MGTRGISSLETEILKPVFHRKRPDGDGFGSRPSGHATTAFAAMAFLSNIVRDTLRPQDEPNVGVRILKEVASAVPYLGAGYMALERVHSNKHFLTDTLLGGAIGAFTTNMFYAWSFTRREQGRSWLEHVSVRYNPGRRGVEVVIAGRF
jgi:membrane-associated phospholipid phosphatase